MTRELLPLADLLGADARVPVYGGGTAPYVNLDNAATTPPLQRVWDRLASAMPMYGSVHRGDGYKSVMSTTLLEAAEETVLQFAGGKPSVDAILLGTNTTACINYLAARIAPSLGGVVVVPRSEHSSNLLPWMRYARVLRCAVDETGRMDLEALERILCTERVGLVSFSGASNVTGSLADVAGIATLAKRSGARVALDASQLAAHRPIPRGGPDDEAFVDYVIFAGHKMYAPFGTGVLLMPTADLRQGEPEQPGGGTVRLITEDEVVWEDVPQREQGGTPNLPGIVALAEACEALLQIGFERIKEHERILVQHLRKAIDGMSRLRSLRTWDDAEDSLPLLPFVVEGHHFAKVSAYLGVEHGIGVRSGHLCQFDLVARLLGLSSADVTQQGTLLQKNDRQGMFGVVRASCGIGTSSKDIELLRDALESLVGSGPRAEYRQRPDGRFEAVDWRAALPAA